MTSEIRVNKLQNRVGLGTVEYTNTGIVVSGIVTCTELSGLTALNIAGVGTANTLDINGDIDVDGHTNLDNVSIAGVTTAQAFQATTGTFTGDVDIASTLCHSGDTDTKITFATNTIKFDTNTEERLRIASTGNVTINNDLDVDGHTNLDNVSIAGVTTFSGNLDANGVVYIRQNASPTIYITSNSTTGSGRLFFGDPDSDLVGRLSYVHNGDYFSFYAGYGERFRIAGNGDITATSIDNFATGPTLKLFHNSGSPAANDAVSRISMFGDDAAGNETEYGRIETVIDDPTDSQETGHINFATRGLGSFANVFRIKRRSTGSAPSYTADDADGVILDVYNTGNPYPRYMNFIAKSAGNTDSNIGFWTEAVGGSPTEKLRISSTGNITIGTAAAAGGKLYFESTSGAAQYIASGGTNNQSLIIGSSAGEFVQITSGGNALFGGTAVSQTNRQLALGSNAEANFAIETHNNAFSESSNIRFYKSRGTAASPTAVADNHYISQLMFYGHDGTDYANAAGYMRVLVDGTVANNQVPGQLQFGVNDGSTATTAMTIHKSGSVLFSGLTDKNDPRNAEGIAIKSASGISFQNFGSNGSRNWRIRPDDMIGWGTLEFAVSPTANSSTDWPDATSDVVLTLHPDKNVSIGNASYGSSLGQLRIINDASTGSGAPASLSLFGHNNTNTGTVFAKIDFASQENGTNGQVTAGIEAQAVGTAERAADLVFKTRPDTSGSSAIERVRMSSSGTTTISGVPAYGAISKTASSSTYVDIFVYDTRKDSDGGAWRHRTNNTSWYNETLNTSIRGARREFPQVAIVAVGGNTIHIFDADDPDMPMWMEFPTPSGGARNVMYGTGNPRCVYMLNGILCTGSQATNYWPVLIDFIRDDIIGLRNDGHIHYNGRQGNISLRDSATSDSGKWWPGTITGGANGNAQTQKRWWFDGNIVNNFVTAVVMDVRPEAPIDKTTGMQIPTIYLGTRGGVSVIHSNSGDTGTSYNSGIYDIKSNNGPYSGVGDITITDDGYLWTLHDYYNYNSDGGYNFYRDSSAIDLKRLDNQMNDMTHSPSADSLSSLNNQGGGSASKGREYYWPSTGAEAGTHRIGYSNTWAANIVERDAWGSPSGLAFVKRGIYTYDHKENASFLPRSHQNRGLVAMITNAYNTGWHMTGSTISCCYITQGLTSNISAGAAAMLDFGYHLRNLDVVGTLTRAACATGSDLSCVSGFSSSNYARIINASLNAGNPIDITLMGWIKLTDISGYSYLCSIGTGSANMGIAVHASDSTNGGKPYFYDSTHGSLQGEKGINDGEWHHVCGVFSCSSNRKILYIDGVRSGGIVAPSNVNYSDLDTIAVGHWCGANGTEVNHSCTGSLALVKLGQTDLTDQQIKRIYEDEKKLFQPNAKAFLYGSSSGVTAIGYDEKKEIYHVGTSSGRSDFSGLSRINNTTTAVTTAISAYDGLIAEQ